jgi:His/Glu/Gln/Arg/opine family amino acid ABC transporter permease subunit
MLSLFPNLLDGFLPQLLLGAKLTLLIAGSSLVVGLVLGLAGALGELSHNRVISKCVVSINAVIRGLPELLVLFAIYFGGAVLLTKLLHHYTEVNAMVAGIVALSLIFAAYAAQVLRGAFLVIPHGQSEAAKSLGLSWWQTLFQILLPQVLQHALPGLSNLAITMLKDSSLVALIGVGELMNKTQIAVNSTHKTFTFYMVAALIYLCMTSTVQIGAKYLTRSIELYK